MQFEYEKIQTSYDRNLIAIQLAGFHFGVSLVKLIMNKQATNACSLPSSWLMTKNNSRCRTTGSVWRVGCGSAGEILLDAETPNRFGLTTSRTGNATWKVNVRHLK